MNVYEAHTFADPHLPFIFHCGTRVTKFEDCPNWHENVEIILFLSGEGYMRHDDQIIPVHQGQIAVINANHLHTFGSQTSLEYHCLIIDRGFCLENLVDTNQLRFDSLFEDPDVARCMKLLEAEYAGTEPLPYRTQVIRGQILYLLSLLCRHHSISLSEVEADSHMLDCVKKAIGYIRAHYQNDISLDQVADFAGVSKYHFAREFRRITGYTFVSYVNLTRCEAAKSLLAREEIAIGTVGINCGFSNQSYFTRTFLRYTGMLPGAYRAKYVKQ
ncbi:MAG: helix-turn-helix transcriptional regulator [Clostridia bacterium]|nr:helix-turn-helix transcriptional regulator [Clostridia bacterium]